MSPTLPCDDIPEGLGVESDRAWIDRRIDALCGDACWRNACGMLGAPSVEEVSDMAQQVIAEIGGTGTQGGGVVEALLKFRGYAVRIPGHEPASDAIKALARRRIEVVILALLIAIFARGTLATAGDQ